MLQDTGLHVTFYFRGVIKQRKGGGGCHYFLPHPLLLSLFFWEKPSSSPHTYVTGLLCAAMRAHWVFDVSIPLLQSAGCHGNALGGSGSKVTVEGRASKGGRSISPLLFCEPLLSAVCWLRELRPEAFVTLGEKHPRLLKLGKTQAMFCHGADSAGTTSPQCGHNNVVKDVKIYVSLLAVLNRPQKTWIAPAEC